MFGHMKNSHASLLTVLLAFAVSLHLSAQTLEPFGKYGCFTPGVESFSMTKYGQVAHTMLKTGRVLQRIFL